MQPALTLTFPASWTQEETVTVRETAMVDGFEGHGEATATASVWVEHTETAATDREASWWAHRRVYEKARAKATAQADARARPIALERAEAAAQAKADEAARPKQYTATWTQEESVTVRETATVDGVVGHGTASASASATVEHTETAETDWEAYSRAYHAAYDKASAKAKVAAESVARPIASERARAEARARAVEAAEAEQPATR